MLETISSLPASFWVAVAALLVSAVWAQEKIRSGIGLPMMAVLGTVSVWYVGDLFYNDYQDYAQTFAPDTIANSFWEIALFLIVFSIMAPQVHKILNIRYLLETSSVYQFAKDGVDDPMLQDRINSLFRAAAIVWAALALFATIRLGTETPYYFFPYISHKADPWDRGRLGSGIDAFLSMANYMQIFVAASFGIVAALAKNPRTRWVAVMGCALVWPYYIFDRTRNVMLSSMLPGALAWVVFRVRGLWVKKAAILASFFLLINAWFGFVLANRDTLDITEAVEQKGFDLTANSTVHHQGLNMFEELCWINTLISNGTYQPSWGETYLAEVVSPIPRALWPEKPMIGIDYAIARGQGYAQGDAGVGASISTGMIGQGVVNFGSVVGPACAAILMSIWVTILARLDLRRQNIVLYGLGLSLTFNMGRDITLLTLYSFVFGSLAIWAVNRFHAKKTGRKLPAERTLGKPTPNHPDNPARPHQPAK